jgi:ABC-2 type transport system ATP-binding protein
MIYTYDITKEDHRIAELLHELGQTDIKFKDLYTEQSSLEEIFVNLVKKS